MELKDILAPLEIELKKVSMLGGNMAIVVIPSDQADTALRAKSETDTAIKYNDYLVIGVFGMGADEASSQFLSIPKGIAVYPKTAKMSRPCSSRHWIGSISPRGVHPGQEPLGEYQGGVHS
jgi:hypothetical protein